MNILILASWYPKNEKDYTGRFILDQADALKAGHRVKVCDVSQSFSILPRMAQEHFQVKSILKELERDGFTPDIIHAHAAYPAGKIALAVKKEIDCPVVLTEHTGPVSLLEGYFKSPAAFASHYSDYDHLVAVSHFLKDQIHKLNPKCQIQVLGNVIPDRYFSIRSSGVRKQSRALFIGRLTEEKGVPELIDALKAYEMKFSEPVEIVIVGQGPLQDRLESIRKELKRCKIEFAGPDKPLHEHYAECGFLLLPSRVETFSLVAAEAIASGIPVLGFTCGGPSDFVAEDRGLLIAERNVSLLADQIHAFAYSEKWKFGDQAAAKRSAYVRERYSALSIATELGKVYKKVLG